MAMVIELQFFLSTIGQPAGQPEPLRVGPSRISTGIVMPLPWADREREPVGAPGIPGSSAIAVRGPSGRGAAGRIVLQESVVMCRYTGWSSEMAVDEIRTRPADAVVPPRRLQLHLCGGRVGERELFERALLDFEAEPVVHSHGDLASLVHALAGAPDRAVLVVIDAEGRHAEAMSELQSLRSRREVATVPIVVIGAGREPERIVSFYRAGASAVVHRSRFVDEWLRALRQIIRFWARAAVVPAAPTTPDEIAQEG
jgi:hypothetical protein